MLSTEDSNGELLSCDWTESKEVLEVAIIAQGRRDSRMRLLFKLSLRNTDSSGDIEFEGCVAIIPGIIKIRVFILSKFQGTYMIDIHFKSLLQRGITNSKLLQVGDYSAHRTTKKMKKIVVRQFAPPCTSVKNLKTFSS
jgi:hypothetical protein